MERRCAPFAYVLTSRVKEYGSYHITGNDIRLEPASESQPIEPSQPTENSPLVTPTPTSAPSSQRFCKYCGGAIDPDTKQCASCGKQFFNPKASSNKLIVTIVVLVVLLGVSGLFVSTYNNGIEAMNNQQFIMAQQYFDKLVVGESLFSDDYAYVEAGVLMETGNYVGALCAFNELEGVPVPVSIIDSLKAKIYSDGKAAYRKGMLDEALNSFSFLEGYEQSNDYILLIECKGDSAKHRILQKNNYNKLIELLDFEDAAEIILTNSYTLKNFLLGRWEDENTSYYFELKADDDGIGYSSQYNLPYINADGYFYLNNGVYSVGETEDATTKIYKFSIIDKETISVYCYKDSSTHELHCVKRYEPPKASAWGF